VQVVDPNTGTPPVELEIQRLGDPSVKIQDIQDYKNDIVMLSGIPSQRLGIQDNYELREKLVQTSINFAETISEMQDTLLEQLLEFYNKLLKISHRGSFGKLDKRINIFKFVSISFHKPIQLQLMYYESIFSSVSNILSALSQIPNLGQQIDYIKLLKHLVPHINWHELIEADITKETEIEQVSKQYIANSNTPAQNNQSNQNNSQPPSLF
jgi:hypothetical protein